MTRDELLELSDERELWFNRLLDAERAAYLLGYAAGRTDQAHADDAAWAAVPVQRVPTGPTLAEIEAARWTVRGEQRTRLTFADPHPADYQGQRQENAA